MSRITESTIEEFAIEALEMQGNHVLHVSDEGRPVGVHNAAAETDERGSEG